MPLFADRVLETTTTTGTGTLTLAGAVTGCRAFSAGHITGELVSYALEGVDANGAPTGEWEVGYGALLTATTLSRLVALRSSNANNLVTLSAGTKRVWSNANALLLSDEMMTGSVSRWNPLPNSSGAPSVDAIAALTALGTATARNVATTNRMTRTPRISYVSAATAGSLAGAYQTVVYRTMGSGTDGGFVYRARFGCGDAATVSGARQFVGLRNATAAPTNVEPNTLTNAIGVGVLSTGTNLQLIAAGGTAQAAIDLGANFPGATLSADFYELTLIAPRTKAGTVLYNVERLGTANAVGGLFANGTPGTTMPTATTFLGHAAWRTNNSTALAVSLDLGAMTYYAEY